MNVLVEYYHTISLAILKNAEGTGNRFSKALEAMAKEVQRLQEELDRINREGEKNG